jgi:hypothetical protein
VEPIISSIAFSGGVCAALLALLFLTWRRIEAAYGAGGIMVYLSLVAFFPLQCLLWPLSLCPPLNNAADPLVLGTGGAVYGLDYENYFAVTLLLTTIPALSLVFLLLQCRWRPAIQKDLTKPVVAKLSSLLSLLSLPLLFLSAVFLVEFFRREGIERLWSSSLDRFEGTLWETGVEGGSQSGSPFMRLYLGFLYLSSIVASVGLAFRNRRSVNVCTLLFNVSPFLVWESRGLSVLATVGILGWVLSLKTSRTRRVALFPALLLILFIYQIPLVLRELPGTGIAKFGEAARLVKESDDFGLRGCAVRTLQSISQCFPNFVYYYEEYDDGANEMDQIPTNYKLLALSPTVSKIDGWAENYMDLQLRVNYYTPISAWSELFLISPSLPYIILTTFSVTLLLLMRKMSEFQLGRLVFSPIVGSLYAVALTMASQYYARTFSRYMWLTLAAGIVLVVINRVAAIRWSLESRITKSFPRTTSNPR